MWEPISENKLLQLIKSAEVDTEVEPPVQRFWARVKVKPQKWNLSPWGDEGGGFWVVALNGQECVYYNDIEDGFNISRFSTFGYIDDYGCNQTELTLCISYLLSEVLNVGDKTLQFWRLGSPKPIFIDNSHIE